MINLIVMFFSFVGLAVCAFAANQYFTIQSKMLHHKEYKFFGYCLAVDYEKGAQFRLILKKEK